MNKLSTEEKVKVVACLVEGNSLRATTRMTGTHRSAIQKLLVELGAACSAYQDKAFRNLKCQRIQCDEIWSFCYAKDKNVPEEMRNTPGVGSVWTWVALDPDTKLVPCWFVSSRDAGAANHFMHELLGSDQRPGQSSQPRQSPGKNRRSAVTSNGFNHDQKTVQGEITRFCSSLLGKQPPFAVTPIPNSLQY